MVGHSDYAFVIDQAGHMRQELDFDPGPGTAATKSSFAAELADAAQQAAGALMNTPAPGRRRWPWPPRCSPPAAAAPPRPRAARGPARPAPPSLATSLVTAAGTWAVAVMGGSAAQHNNFWQLFMRPAGSSAWKLVTPPGVADNGGLVLADAGAQSLVTGFRPSQYLTYTPLTVTRDGGQAWSSAGPLDAALANAPDALAAAPGSGHLLALLTSGTVKLAAPATPDGQPWPRQRSLAATAGGQALRPAGLTAAAFTRLGMPVLGWHAAAAREPPASSPPPAAPGRPPGPPLPAALARQHDHRAPAHPDGQRRAALLAAGTGLQPACSPPGPLTTAATGPCHRRSGSNGSTLTASIVRTRRHHGDRAGPATARSPSPAPQPRGAHSLHSQQEPRHWLQAQAGEIDALAVHRTKLTIWQLATGSSAWKTTQAITVPIQFGSSS